MALTAAAVGIPHFALPLQYRNGSALVNEQNSVDDMADCVYAVCVTNPGDRVEYPTFGLQDMAFGQQPLNASAAVNQIEDFEPRVSVLIDLAPDRFDETIVNAQVNVEPLS